MAQLLVSLVFIACVSSCYATYYTYKYMDDSDLCWGNTYYISSFSSGVKVSAWNPSSLSKTPLSGGCQMTIASYGSYGMKFKFSSDSYISATDVTINVYKGSSIDNSQLGSYSSTGSLPTCYTYTHGVYITIKLNNPSKSTNFRLTMIVDNFDDLHQYASSGSFSVGGIIASVVGSIVFIIFMSLISVCIRRRRIVTRAAIIRAEAPVAQVTTSAQINYPAPPPPYPTGQAPYPAGNVKYPTTGAGYPAATTAYPPP